MKILITGYKGFIGQNMTLALADHELSFFEWGDSLPKVDSFKWVIHLGAISSTTETDVDKVMRQNYEFSRWLLDECHEAGVNFQYASSASVYGINPEFHESALKNPMSPYAWSKYFFDRYVEQKKWQGIIVQGFRYFNVYGAHEEHKGNQASPYHVFTKQAKETGVIRLFEGSENFKRDFVPVELVTDLHQQFFNVKESGIWNIGTGQATSFEHVAQTIADKYQARIEYIAMPDKIRNQYQAYTCADLTKLNATLASISYNE